MNLNKGLSMLRYLPAFLKAPILRSSFDLEETTEEMIFKIAESPEEYEQAFQILHEGFVARGYMRRELTGLRVTKYHIHPATTVLIAKIGGEVIATLSVIGDSAVGLPMEKNWDISLLRSTNKRLGEISGLAVRKDYQSKRGQILFPLFRFMKDYSVYYAGIETIVASTSVSARDFYRHVLLFKPIDNLRVKKYDWVKGSKSVAQYIDLDAQETRDRLKAVYGDKKFDLFDYFYVKVFKNFRFPGPIGAKCTWSTLGLDDIRYFLLCQESLKAELTSDERKKIAFAYPNAEYSKLILGDSEFHQKVDTRFAAKSEINIFLSDQRFQGALRSASLNGMQAFFERRVPPGEVVNCLVKSPPSYDFMVRAKVVWNRNAIHGLQIIGPVSENWSEFVNELGSSFRAG